jgi:hypothetical protein
MTHHFGSGTLKSREVVDTTELSTTDSSSSSHSHFSFAAFQHRRSPSRTTTDPVQDGPTNKRRSFLRSRSKSPVPPSHSQTLPVRKSHDHPRDVPVHASTIGGRASPSRVAFEDADGAMIERTTSPVPMSPHQRTSSSPSAHNLEFPNRSHTNSHSNSHSSRKSGDYKRLSGTVNHCGRHANDWLFGGFSVRESVGKLWKEEEK